MLRLFRVAIIALVMPALTGCATMKAGSHIEHGAEFTHYRTWEWGPTEALPTGDPRLDNNHFFQERLRGAVERQMTRKGYVRSALSGSPNLFLHYHVNFSKTFDITNGAPSGSCDRNCEPEAYAYEQGTLVIDVTDAQTTSLVWRGWSRDNMEGVIDNQARMEREIDDAVAAMFELFPGTPD